MLPSSVLQLKSLQAELLNRQLVATRAAELDLITNAKKVPIVAGIVEKILNESSTDSQLLLLDVDGGEIQCCVHAEVTLHYPTVMERGSALVLQDVTVMPTAHRPMLIVCLRNIAALFEAGPDETERAPNAEAASTVIHHSHHHYHQGLPQQQPETFADDELELADDF